MSDAPGQFTHRPLEETRTVRVLRILRLIDTEPEAWTRRALAEKFVVSERMVDKDLRAIRAAGYVVRRHRAGYAIEDDCYRGWVYGGDHSDDIMDALMSGTDDILESLMPTPDDLGATIASLEAPFEIATPEWTDTGNALPGHRGDAHAVGRDSKKRGHIRTLSPAGFANTQGRRRGQ